MTNSELLSEVEALQQELEEHRRSWEESLDETLPDFPRSNVEELRRQCRSLSRRLGAIGPHLRVIRSNWAMGAGGSSWDALEEAIRPEQAAAIKGPSLTAVIEALDQVIGHLGRQVPTDVVALADQHLNRRDQTVSVPGSQRDSSGPLTAAWQALLRLPNPLRAVAIAVVCVLAVGLVVWKEIPDQQKGQLIAWVQHGSPPAVPLDHGRPQRLDWIAADPTRGTGACIDECSAGGFIAAAQFLQELEANVLPHVRGVPAGSTLAMRSLQDKRDWVIVVRDRSGITIANIWVGGDPAANWKYDGLIRVGLPDGTKPWGMSQRFTDGSYQDMR